MTKNILFPVILLFFASCSGSNIHKKWSCRNTDSKLGCVSISEADKAYNSDSLDESITKILKSDNNKYTSFDIDNAGSNKKLIRTSDKIGRIWFAPYMDAGGNYHEASYVRTVDEIAKWEIRNFDKNK